MKRMKQIKKELPLEETMLRAKPEVTEEKETSLEKARLRIKPEMTEEKETLLVKIAYIFATWFGSGLSPKAPGTVGSLCSLPLVYVVAPYGWLGILTVSVVVFFIGWWATHIVLKTQEKHDPGFVVIDETVGQTLTFLWVAGLGMMWYHYVIGFAFFRFFDIVKMGPVSYFDKKVQNAFGVMTDDVMAGLCASVVLYGLQFLI